MLRPNPFMTNALAAVLLFFFAFHQEAAGQTPASIYDHFFYMRHNKDEVAKTAKTDSLVLVKVTPSGFEERVVYTKGNLGLSWRPLHVAGGKLYAKHLNELLCIDLATGKAEKIDRGVAAYWRTASKLQAAVAGAELRVYDLATSAYRSGPAPDAVRTSTGHLPLTISPDGRLAAFFKLVPNRKAGRGPAFQLHSIDLATGQATEIGPEIHTVIYAFSSPFSLDGDPPPFAWQDAKTILVEKAAPGPIVGQPPAGKVMQPEKPSVLVAIDVASGKTTEIVTLPRWTPSISKAAFHNPDAKGVPRIILGDLGQFRIDIPGKRLIEDDSLRGDYRYRRGQPSEQIWFGETKLAEAPRFNDVSVAPTDDACIWQSGKDVRCEVWHHDGRDGKPRLVASGWLATEFRGSLLWARAADIVPAAAQIPNGWKAFDAVPYP